MLLILQREYSRGEHEAAAVEDPPPVPALSRADRDAKDDRTIKGYS